ncbi:MAG: elongation factor Ts [Hyphomicrobiaceae bacterium]|nr:elongation factor Ts [Hyphomicrobiaceae bacterium]
MTVISASLVKDLRERTGVGMMDCKAALTETKGDIEAAIDWLRKKGLAKAAKKAGRTAAEGLVGVIAEGRVGAVAEVNSETDFVARNDQFQDMVRTITKLALANDGDVAKTSAATYPGKTISVDEVIKETVATIGENMNLRRAAVVKVSDGVVAEYLHNKVTDGLGKIGVLVGLESKGDKPSLFELGRLMAMHVAATNPIALDITGVPAAVLDREKNILAEKNVGKPPQVLEKIFQSSLKSFAKEQCLLDQAYIHDGGKSVAQALKDAEGKVGAPVKITGFVRFALGDGIEKEKDDFAEEVKKAAGGA